MNKNVCIGLCVYNNSAGLPAVLNNIDKLTTVFEKVNIIACYDVSQDNSLEILNEYQKLHSEIQLDIIDNTYGNRNCRTENIANARNSILDKIRESYSDYTYFIMMDSNEYSCIGDLNTNVIEEILQRDNEWDSVSFDREAGYYDTWALSYDPYIYSFFHFGNSSKVVSMMREHFNALMENAKREDRNQFIPVYSAFNGFAIYKSSMFLNCSYSSNIDLEYIPMDIVEKEVELTESKLKPIFSDDCEHRKFHMESIHKNGSKIRISLKSVFSKLAEPIPHLRGPA